VVRIWQHSLTVKISICPIILFWNKTNPLSAQVAAMNAMQHETSLKLVSFPLKICWSFLETPFNLHWNSLERPLKLPWNTDWLPLNPFDILWCCTTFQMNYRPFELLWNTHKNASKHTLIFLEAPMKLSWKTFKTSLKHPWNTHETPWLIESFWHFLMPYDIPMHLRLKRH